MRVFTLLASMILIATALFGQSKFSPTLLEEIDLAVESERPVKALITLTDRFDIKALDKQLYAEKVSLGERAYRVITTLQAHAAATQPPVLDFISSRVDGDVLSVRPFWVANLIAIEAMPNVLYELSERSDVLFLNLDSPLQRDVPVEELYSESIPNGKEPGLTAINAPLMWQAGFTGQGTIVMNLDTGVEGSHPALDYKWRGTHRPPEESWYDAVGSSTFPWDGDNHGTHTIGTMCGLDPATNDTIGVAFDAEWIASNSLMAGGHTSASLASFEWGIDPDGNPETSDDMPAGIGNSWWDPGIASSLQCNPDLNPYIDVIAAVEAAGIGVVFSAGNSGSGPSTITSPKNANHGLVDFFATGALDGNNNVAGFSSRGPVVSECVTGDERLDTKPEASAPGVAVRSAIIGGYGNFSGTSMACPHVVGAIALLRSALPNKTGHELKMALYETAQDLGEEGEDNNYGMGIIDVWAAFQSFADSLDPERPTEFQAYSDYLTPDAMTLTWEDPTVMGGGDPLPVEDFVIEIERDDVWIGSVPGGTGTFEDNGLVDGQEYAYGIYARIISSDSTGNRTFADWHAGGSPVPAAPADLVCEDAEPDIVLAWTDPTTQADGTPLDDLQWIIVWRDGELIDVVAPGVETYVDSPPEFGIYEYYLTALDDESEENESFASNTILCSGGDDVTAPEIDHAVVPFGGIDDLPVRVEATVTDNNDVEEVWVEYNLNDGPTESFTMVGATDFVGIFPFTADDVVPGDSIFYTVMARDVSTNKNVTTHGEHSFEIRNNFSISQTVNVAIPNNDSDGISRIISVSVDPGDVIGGVDVEFEATHPNLGDLSIWLTSPSGTEVKIMERPGHPAHPTGDPGDDPDLLLDDEGEISIEDIDSEEGDNAAGRFSPDPGMLSEFAGEDPNGQWTMRVSDEWAPNTGTFTSWGLIITLAPPTSIEHGEEGVPREFSVAQNYPNPFNPTTTIEYQLPEFSTVNLTVYNMLGQVVDRLVVDVQQPAGKYEIAWDASSQIGTQVSTGIYVYRFEATGSSGERFVRTRKMLLLK